MAPAAPATDQPPGGFLSPRAGVEPSDRCFRCGRETPAGVGLCEEHNPRGSQGPSSTQMHATVFIGVVIGVVGFFILATQAMGSAGPYPADVVSAVADGSGGVALTFALTNEGSSDGMADCRVTRDGVPRPDDLAFRSPPLAAGESVTLERALSGEVEGPFSYDAEFLTVVCA